MAIIKNITTGPAVNVELNDLAGITVLANSDYDLSIEPAEAVAGSQDLIAAIALGQLVYLNEDGTEMTQSESTNVASQAVDDKFVAITSTDSSTDYLNNKVVAGTNIAIAILNPGANEILEINATGTATGEANTASNIGTAGVGVYAQKVGDDLQFKNINTGSTKVTITNDIGNNEIDIDIVEGNIVHQNLSGAGTNTHAQIDSHIADGTIHFTQAAISITESQISDLGSYSLTGHTHSIKDLSDVLTTMTPVDGQVLTFDTTNGWQAETSATGITDHTLLSNIGTNTHAQIDTHLADGTIHFTQASISITESQISDLGTYIPTSEKAAINGVATLGGDGKIPSGQLPAIAITDVYVVANITARDALTVQTGDVAKVNDIGGGVTQTYIWDGLVWIDIQETSDVISVNGQTGVVTLTTTNVAEGTNLYYTDGKVDARIALQTLTGHADVTITTPADNEVLAYNSGTTQWINQTPAEAGLATATDLSNHTSDGTIHFTQAAISITESQISDFGTYSLSTHTHSIKDLSDVLTTMTPIDGQVLTFDTTNGWQAETSPAGVTDHTLLSNIGTNTHVQIDTHIADGTIHFTQAAIIITESQISDLQSYSLDTHTHTINELSNVLTGMTPIDGQVLTFDTTNGWQAETPIDNDTTDHTLLTNIGTNTHVQIDSHIADGTIHTANDQVAISATDTTPGYLGAKIIQGSNITLTINNAGANETITISGPAAAGEANTASNVGTAGVGVFKQKNLLDLEFKNINAGSTKVTITNDIVNDEIDIDIVEGNIIHQNLNGAGTNTHAQIDTHIADTTNPHSTAVSKLTDVNPAITPLDGHVLYYDTINSRWDSTKLFTSGAKQTIQSTFGTIGEFTGTTVIAVDAVAPLITDGTQIWTDSFTPSNAASEIKVTTSLAFSVTNASSGIVVTIFRDTTCIGVMSDSAANGNSYQTVQFTIKDPGPFIAGTPVTYSARIGKTGGNATWYVNTDSSGNNFGGVLSNNAYTIEEVVLL